MAKKNPTTKSTSLPPPKLIPAQGLLKILRGGVAITDKITKPIQAYVTYRRHLGDDGYGGDAFGDPVQVPAICDWIQVSLTTSNGQLAVSRSSVQFLNIEDVVRITNGEGIGDQDEITMPDGTTGPILDMKGFIDAGTGHPLATEVFLG